MNKLATNNVHMPKLATSWTSRGSNPDGGWWGEILRTHLDGPWDPPSLLYSAYQVIPGVERWWRGIDHPHHPVLRFKKEYSYTSTPTPGLHGQF